MGNDTVCMMGIVDRSRGPGEDDVAPRRVRPACTTPALPLCVIALSPKRGCKASLGGLFQHVTALLEKKCFLISNLNANPAGVHSELSCPTQLHPIGHIPWWVPADLHGVLTGRDVTQIDCIRGAEGT